MTFLPEIPKASHAALLEEQARVEQPETFLGVPQRLGRKKHLTGSLGEAQKHLVQRGERFLFQKTPPGALVSQRQHSELLCPHVRSQLQPIQ